MPILVNALHGQHRTHDPIESKRSLLRLTATIGLVLAATMLASANNNAKADDVPRTQDTQGPKGKSP